MVQINGVAVRPKLNTCGKIGQTVRNVSKNAVTTVEKTEDFDKLMKFVKAILDAFSFVGLATAIPNIKGVVSVISDGTKILNGTNIFSRVSECTSFYEFAPNGKPKGSFYQTPNPKFTVNGFDFKRVSRGFLFGGHTAAALHVGMTLAGQAKLAGFYIGKTVVGIVLPGVELFMNAAIWVSSLLNGIGTSISLHRANQEDKTVKVAIHKTKWEARARLLNALETNDVAGQEKQKKIYLKCRAKLNPGEEAGLAEAKWGVLTDRNIVDDIEQLRDVRKIVDRKVKLYTLKTQKLNNERHKSIVTIVNEIAKMALITMAIIAATLTMLVVTPVVPFLPFFVAFGLIAGTTGIWKVLIDRKSTKDATTLQNTVNEQRNHPAPVNHIRNAYEALVRA